MTKVGASSMMKDIEQEVIYLLAVVDLIKSMVNREMLDVRGDSILFKTQTHHRLFAIALVDFLSATDKKPAAPVPSKPFLGAVKNIAAQPSFNVNGSVSGLRQVADDFASWLNTEISVDAWLPSIDQQLELRPSRRSLHCIVGNLSKHNFLRSIGIANELKTLLASAGAQLDEHDAIRVQEDIYEHFHNDVGLYHSSVIAEFLNNIWWGIQTYLKPEYLRSFTRDPNESYLYSFQYPTGITDPFARACYWELMNRVRSGPIFGPFSVSSSFKSLY